jgi:hypothetical protein
MPSLPRHVLFLALKIFIAASLLRNLPSSFAWEASFARTGRDTANSQNYHFLFVDFLGVCFVT